MLQDPAPSGSVFLVTSLLLLPPHTWQAAVVLASRPIPACAGIQKTFSAEPCSFSTKELWFPSRALRSRVQPVIDSRHGRITCKTLLLAVSKEQRAAASNQSFGSNVQHLLWLAAALKNQLAFML